MTILKALSDPLELAKIRIYLDKMLRETSDRLKSSLMYNPVWFMLL